MSSASKKTPSSPRKGCRPIKCHQVAIYIVTTMRHGVLYYNTIRSEQLELQGISDKECRGWFSDFYEAEEYITTPGIMYTARSSRGPSVAVIEKVKQASSDCSKEWWYAFDIEKGFYVKAEKPADLRQVISFWR